jgi:hypothetical protein
LSGTNSVGKERSRSSTGAVAIAGDTDAGTEPLVDISAGIRKTLDLVLRDRAADGGIRSLKRRNEVGVYRYGLV